MEVVPRKAPYPCHLLQRNRAAGLAVQKLAALLQAPEQLFPGRGLHRRYPRHAHPDLFVKQQQPAGKQQKFFLEAAGEQRAGAPLRHCFDGAGHRSSSIKVQPGQKRQCGRRALRSLQRILDTARGILGRLFHIAAAEERARGLHGALGVDIHGILLPSAQDQEARRIHHHFLPAHNPCHGALHHRLDG